VPPAARLTLPPSSAEDLNNPQLRTWTLVTADDVAETWLQSSAEEGGDCGRLCVWLELGTRALCAYIYRGLPGGME